MDTTFRRKWSCSSFAIVQPAMAGKNDKASAFETISWPGIFCNLCGARLPLDTAWRFRHSVCDLASMDLVPHRLRSVGI